MLLLIAGAVIVVVTAVALVAGVLDHDSGVGRFADADPADAATVRVPDDYVTVGLDDVRMSLPASWVWVSLEHPDVAGLGDHLAPDDPRLAADLDDRLRTLPRSTLLVGMDEGDLDPRQFNTNLIVLRLPDAMPDGAEDVRAAVAADLRAQHASVSSVSYLTGGDGPVLRVRYQMSQQGVEVDAVQYWYATSDAQYTLLLTSDSIDDYVEVADAVASSFDAGTTA